ncbi:MULTISPECIES: type 2 lanthipeptide synthetase LanM family protein [Paenibacillus]|jgi:type 2 lantibiotic biosynthesis protein LanM|uniref:type 2 lanthipeptide synthetase LanM family protein n=2 Tax=Paenibacillus TaxID=44249 RepID=UPI0009E00904|nr:type 2 lanthipeptide synthetase LanM family protein [Paenibacillus sp. FSL P4-0081]
MMIELQTAFKQSAYLHELTPFHKGQLDNGGEEIDYTISDKALNNKLCALQMTKQDYEYGIYHYEELLENHSPDWVRIIQEVTAFDPKAVSDIKYELPHKSFITYFTPFILYVQHEFEVFFEALSQLTPLMENKIDTHQYMSSVIAIIHGEIDKLSTKMLIAELNIARLEGRLEGNTGEDRYIYFVEQYFGDPRNFAEIFEVYPVLGRILCERIVQLIDIHKLLVNRFIQDYAIIEAIFGFHTPCLIGVEGDLGDSHKKGSSVEIIETSAGKLVYKPRSLMVDAHFTEVVNWLNNSGVKYPLRTAKVLDRKKYGWQEFIPYNDCTDEAQVQRFFYRQGMNVALLYAFRSVDFHNENLIASGEYPILIDLETLFDNHLDLFKSQNELHVTVLELKNSVLSSLMLPIKFKHDQMLDYDLSGIAGRGGQKSKKNKGYGITNFGTDAMFFAEKELLTQNKLNVPAINGHEIDIFSYKQYLLEGFRDTYHSIEMHKNEFESLMDIFSNDEIRHVFRPTNVYGKFLDASIHPKYLQRGIDREGLFDYMWSLTEWSDRAHLFVSSEINDLVNHDVPYFTFRAGNRNLYNAAGEEFENFYNESSIALVKARIRSFSKADCLKQERYISLSMATLIDNVWKGNLEQPAQKLMSVSLEEEVQAIADGILSTALYDEKGRGPVWISTNVGDEDAIYLSPLPPGVYDGLGGLAIFYAQLGVTLGSAEYEKAARSILNELINDEPYWLANMDSTSAFFGIGTFVYLYSYLGCLWGDATLLERAVNTLPAIEKLLPLEKDIDIIRGHAGLLKVLTNLYQAYPNDEVKRVLQSLTDQFLSELGNTVLQEDSMRSAGFAHGLSGIVFSLAHVQSVLSSHAIEQTVIELLRIENEFYVEASRKWLDLRENKHALASNYWCHGSYGILLARAHIGSLLPDVPTELLLIDRLMEDVLEEQSGPIGHSMCHGEVGNRNIIMDVRSLVSGREPVDTENVAQFNRIPGQLWQTGMHPDIESLGLFTGLSGIGLGLLRFLDPKIPSILSLDIPKYEEVICS